MIKAHRSQLRLFALAALCALSAGAQATITSYGTSSSFLAAVSAPATDSFDQQALGGPNFPYVATAGGYGYSADAQFDGIYFVGSASDVWLSTTSPAEYVVFYDFTTPVYGIAGQFFGTDFDGAVIAGLNVTVQAFNGVDTLTRTLSNTNADSFIGFVSDRPLVNFAVLVAQPAGSDAFTTVNNLTLAVSASAVPEPTSAALWLLGLAACGLGARARVSRAAPPPAPCES